MVKEMKINHNRLLADLKAIRKITDTPGAGVTRFSYGDKDKEAREYILSSAKNAGFDSHVDGIGNIYIGSRGSGLRLDEEAAGACSAGDKKIVVGSHIDTVKNGGWLDGIYGVISGLEVIRTLKNACENLVLVIFAEEEGSNFGSCMTGSKFISGIYEEEDLISLKNDRGTIMRKMLTDCGYDPYEREKVVWNFSCVKAMLELHIEQGPVLHEEGISIGIVDWVNGMSVVDVILKGTGNHAGATPMCYRRDALTAASEAIVAVESVAKNDEEGITVATVGKLNVEPNCSNVIPEEVSFTVEVRDKNMGKINDAMNEIKKNILKIASIRNVKCEFIDVTHSQPIRLNGKIKETIIRKTKELGYSHRTINSGAVHDACMVAPYAPTGMIFVPSKDGRSHVRFEDTKETDLIKGAQVLLDTVIELL